MPPASYRHLPRVLPDGPQHPDVGETAAQHARQRLPDLLVGRLWIPIEERLRRQNDAVEAETALCGLLVDEGSLDRMRPVDRSQALEGGDLRATDISHRRDAG